MLNYCDDRIRHTESVSSCGGCFAGNLYVWIRQCHAAENSTACAYVSFNDVEFCHLKPICDDESISGEFQW